MDRRFLAAGSGVRRAGGEGPRFGWRGAAGSGLGVAFRTLGAGAPTLTVTVLVTRPEPDGAEFAAALRRATPGPWRALLAPLQRIVPLPQPSLAPGAELVLTSRNAVRALGSAAAGRRAWCVGGATAKAARAAGMEPVDPRGAPVGDADALVAWILARAPRAPLLHLRGADARGAVAERLRAGGLAAEEVVVYRQEAIDPPPEALRALAGPGPVVAPVFSPRAALLLSRMAEGAAAPIHAVALSPAVARALELPGAAVTVCPSPDGSAMIEALAPILRPPHDPGHVA